MSIAGMVKDYYSILGIAPTASASEIKLAYRALAKQFHPDITGNDPSALHWYNEIKTAYEVLMNPVKRYRYQEEIWLLRSQGKNMTKQSITDAGSILKDVIQLEKNAYYSGGMLADPYFLSWKISELLQPENIAILNAQPDFEINQTIVQILLNRISGLPVSYLELFSEKIKLVAEADKINTIGKMEKLIQERKKTAWLQKNSWIAAVLLTLMLLMLLWLFIR